LPRERNAAARESEHDDIALTREWDQRPGQRIARMNAVLKRALRVARAVRGAVFVERTHRSRPRYFVLTRRGDADLLAATRTECAAAARALSLDDVGALDANRDVRNRMSRVTFLTWVIE